MLEAARVYPFGYASGVGPKLFILARVSFVGYSSRMGPMDSILARLHIIKKKKGPLWNPNAFLRMPNFKFLRVRNINLLHVPTQLSNNLRFIEWSDYPSKSLPYFQLNELVQLHLRQSKIVILWEGKKVRVLISIFIQI